MLPSNVMSFMKKMVAQEEAPQSTQQQENTGTFGKLKQTLSSSLLTAQDRVNKISPRPSLVPDSTESQIIQQAHQQALNQPEKPPEKPVVQKPAPKPKVEPGRPPTRIGACRVCLKSFKPDDFSKTCFECKQRVCEDCASYSKMDDSEDLNTWRCSVCRRKMASRICIPQDSTDSSLDVPILEALQRRHSDVKLNVAPANGLGLAPPRSPELRRHSDVSPASLKELEKLKGGGSKTPNPEFRSTSNSRSNSPPRCSRIEIEPPTRQSSRRQSRVSRQHSYDDDIKNAAVNSFQGDAAMGLVMPAIPRRKSAYDVFATGNAQQLQQQLQQQQQSQRPSDMPDKSSRRSSYRGVAPSEDSFQNDNSPSPDNGPTLLIDDPDRRMRRRGSQLPDIAALRDRGALGATTAPMSLNPTNPYQGPALEDLEAPKRQTSLDGEAIKIVIHDVDFDSGTMHTSKRRVILKRDPSDKAHRTRGFGMRVVGGKTGTDGKLFAHIVWTVPSGPAEKGGLQQGDKILEWCGLSLVDRSFEEVCSIMDRTGDMAELVVEHAPDFRMCDLLEDNGSSGGGGGPNPGGNSGNGPMIPVPQRKNSDCGGLVAESESTIDKSPSSPTRRKLPKTPEQLARERQVSGRVQIQVWYHGDRSELVVNLMAADDLALRDDSIGYGNQPEAYAKVKILGDAHVAQTEVSSPTLSPIWNATLTFAGVKAESLMDRWIEIGLWDLVPHCDPVFLGECMVELQKAFLDDRAVWYRLEDPKGMRSATMVKTPSASPRGSIQLSGDVSRFIRRNDYQRSASEDSLGDGCSLLHPDHAYIAGSRRGSSQSETLEVETYQLSKDFSRSLPGSRRSSYDDRTKTGESTPQIVYISGRRRSSCIRKDPDEILRSLKQVRGELGRTMSLPREPELSRSASRRFSRSSNQNSITNLNEMDPNFRGSGNFTALPEPPQLMMGPGQIQPRGGYSLRTLRFGELKLGFTVTKAALELQILMARKIVPLNAEPPDTYVKCYLKDSDRMRQKKKTDIVRSSAEPIYNKIIKYATSEILGRSIIVMVWQRCLGFEQNQGLGGCELYFDRFNLNQYISGWYPLFPMYSLGLDTSSP